MVEDVLDVFPGATVLDREPGCDDDEPDPDMVEPMRRRDDGRRFDRAA